MAISLNNDSKRGGRGRARQMSDINVTPMVDVMLVLLVIFMVTAPLLTVGVQVELPKAQASGVQGDDQPLTVTIDNQGRIYIGEKTEVHLDELGVRLMAIAGAKPDTRIFVRGDKGISYGRIMEVMGAVSTSGFTKVALLTELPAAGKPTPDQPAPGAHKRSR
ncbi:MAG: protein TolR [Alphaproteobacteria bacterium]|nr:protein TolR [Alphaproteobacteria bacterium]